MKKTLSLLLLILPLLLSGLQVNVNELKKEAKEVKFINYEGKTQKKDTVDEVKSIGVFLSQKASKNNQEFKFYNKYSIIRAFSKDEPEKLNADIFIIQNAAKVNHIKNIRRILAGYLAKQFRYSEKDSELIALFITYYNAFYRGDMKYFENRYKKVVLKHITAKNAGIALKYSDWPGKTRMLVPLEETLLGDKKKEVDPFVVADKKVVEELRKTEDKGVEERKDIVELKEKNILKEEKLVEEAKKTIEKDKKAVEEAKKNSDKKEEAVIKEEKKIEEAEKKVEAIKDPEKKKEEKAKIEEKKAQIEKEKEKITEETKKTEAKEKEIAKKEEAVEKTEVKLEEKKKDLAEEKKVLETDKKEVERNKNPELLKQDLKAKETELEKTKDKLEETTKELEKKKEEEANKADKGVFKGKFYYLKIKEFTAGGHYLNDFFIIDAYTKQILAKSPLDKISGRQFNLFKEGAVVIAFEGKAHHLVLLDLNDLKPKVIGRDDVFVRSFVEIRENSIYAVFEENKKYYLGKFDENLKLTAKSVEPIHEDSVLSFFDQWIYVNGESRNILVLNKNDLSLADTIKP
ncbi:MAG TPA: hypothetical protein DHW82_00280 [Spirochaetia bacterium]|nr:MAG: hypothetical protein A2Y41_00860 [Spirochaetes bacterium GWB1_36_13]HCL55437.1 hypothetical protein [Spirochaetia bacterium]